jgi:ABC-2 type transport system ATP-binding protein
MTALKVENLRKIYRSVEAVQGVSFEVRPGEIFALVGPNGAGKSTTLKMVATILKPTDGAIRLMDVDVLKDPGAARRMLSYLPEEAGAYKNLTGLDYLDFIAAIFYEDVLERRKAADRAAELTGLKDRLEDKVKTYSKGMTRKLLLARAVMTRPTLAILDEPTSGLDILAAFEIRKILKDLAGEGMSVLLSSHNMLEIESLAGRAAIIHGGRILDSGTVAEIKARHNAANLEEAFARIIK